VFEAVLKTGVDMPRFDYKRAVMLQEMLASRVLSMLPRFPSIDPSRIKIVAGVDAAYRGGMQIGAAVAVDYGTGELLDYVCQASTPPIPYVPGLLAFREAPVYIKALRRLRVEPDIILVDGHGLSHPRALGIATHIGLVLGKPTIGVAKKPLYGEIREANGSKYIVAHGAVVGGVIELGKKSRLYVSTGYLVKPGDAVKITMQLLKPGEKLPIPLSIADKYSKDKCLREAIDKQ